MLDIFVLVLVIVIDLRSLPRPGSAAFAERGSTHAALLR